MKRLVYLFLSLTLLVPAVAAEKSGGTADEIAALQTEIRQLRKDGKTAEQLPLLRKLAGLGRTEEERARFEWDLAVFLAHTLQRKKESLPHYRAVLQYCEKNLASPEKTGRQKLPLLERCIFICRTGTLDKPAEKKYRERKISLLKEMLAGAEGPERISLLRDLEEQYRSLNMADDAAALRSEIFAAWKKRLDAAKALPPEKWLREAAPLDAVAQLGRYRESYVFARDLADRIIAMKELPVERKRSAVQSILSSANVSPAPGADRLKYAKWLAENTREARWREYYGSLLFHQEHRLNDARKVFTELRDDPASSAEVRRKAVLWLNMLSDD